MKREILHSDVIKTIRDVPDFPVKGIVFKDITTAIKDPDIYEFMVDQISGLYAGAGITKVLGIESRGFILGGALAYKLHAGFVPVRKPGKLPAPTHSKSYALEYGENILHIHKDALNSDDVVLVHDDLVATGGSAAAVIELVKLFNVKKIYLNFIFELGFLKGREILPSDIETTSLIKF
jgi:adenine phosphoribosyltransferase